MTEIAIGETFRVDDPDNYCVGCSPHNPKNLGLEFTRTGDNTIEIRYRAPNELCGYTGIVHGGIQALLLDEAMGVAIMQSPMTRDDLPFATVELTTRYRRPAPVERELIIRSEVTRREGSHVFLSGSITDDSGQVVTSGEARWTRL